MKIVALIPARANSKRIDRKNRRKLLGQPLIVWTIKTAKNVKEINDIYVSTDDEEIIKICKKFKLKVPWKRPKNLSSDTATSRDVILHFLNWYEKKISKIDGLLFLQPTSPFRKKSSIQKAIKLFKKNSNKAITSFSPLNKRELSYYFYLNKKTNNVTKSLDFIDLVKLNGSIFLTSPKNFRKFKSFPNSYILPLVQNSLEESIDIDTHEDWKLAEKLKR